MNIPQCADHSIQFLFLPTFVFVDFEMAFKYLIWLVHDDSLLKCYEKLDICQVCDFTTIVY